MAPKKPKAKRIQAQFVLQPAVEAQFDGPTKRKKAKPTRLDYWQLGYKAVRERGPGLVAAATHGWAVLDNMCELFDETCKPCKEQCEYIIRTNEDNKQVIFENAIWSDVTSSIGLDVKSDRVGARMMLKPAGHSGKWGKIFVDYTRKYKEQQTCIIRGMFADEPASDPEHWITKQTSVVGGTHYQHPHCDSGRAGRYQNLSVFPFVNLHGFGEHSFSLWILPEEYGFLHTFRPDQILFMRGDFVHAGVPSPLPRGHMAFYPLPPAGWVRRSAFWTKPDWKDTSFPWQQPTFPFGYPDVGTPDEKGNQIVSYPVQVTQALQLALPSDTVVISKHLRMVMKKRFAGQLYLL